ncbi:MAG: hypothetical protein K2X32_07940, partial [Phycisphaerales bacterium]|nr:hypothetical protein [Phycisphaerales bacterium]
RLDPSHGKALYQVACAHANIHRHRAATGNADANARTVVIDALARAIKAAPVNKTFAVKDPAFDLVRESAEFQAMTK